MYTTVASTNTNRTTGANTSSTKRKVAIHLAPESIGQHATQLPITAANETRLEWNIICIEKALKGTDEVLLS